MNEAVYETRLSEYNSTERLQTLLLKDAPLLLHHDYLLMEAGYFVLLDNMHHGAASTYMRGCCGQITDLWFCWICHTHQNGIRGTMFWDGKEFRENNSSYIAIFQQFSFQTSLLVHAYVSGQLAELMASLQDPSLYFGNNLKEGF